MRTTTFPTETLRAFLQDRQIATLDELKHALGTASTMTVFRKLKALDYLTSYSHRGKYYALRQCARFDDSGLWQCRGVCFSQHGNLKQTALRWIEQSQAGFTAAELQQPLNIPVKQPLLVLWNQKQIRREKVEGHWVYFAQDSTTHRQQSLRRRQFSQSVLRHWTHPRQKANLDQIKTAILLFFTLLNEKQRRLYAGLESLYHGHGGDAKIAALLGLDAHTVAKGRRELLEGNPEPQNIRQSGGGRWPVEKKRRKSSPSLKNS